MYHITAENGRTYLSKNERIKLNNDRIKKQKRHKNAALIFFSLVGLVAVFIILAVTVFFKTDKIVIEGSERYSYEEILQVSGAAVGDRLLLTRDKEISGNITRALVYADKVRIKKELPGTLIITVTDAREDYAVDTGAGFVLFSASGKVLQQNSMTLPEGCAVVAGLNEISTVPGSRICDSADGTYRLFVSLTQTCREHGLTDVTYVSVADERDICIVYDGRITLKFGAASNLTDKIITAVEVIKRENASKPNRFAVIDVTNELKVYARDAEHTTVPVTEPETEDYDVDYDYDNDDYDNDDYDDDDDGDKIPGTVG